MKRIRKGTSGVRGAAAVIVLTCLLVSLTGCSGSPGSSGTDDKATGATTSAQSSGDDFKKLGQGSFGVDVKAEVTKEQVAEILGKPIVKVEDYSNSGSTGAEYFVDDDSFVIIDVGYGSAANQKKGLEALDRKTTTDSTIGLENFIAISDTSPGEYIDIYMVIDPAQKYVRVGRSSVGVCDNATLVKLAQKVEEIIRSFK